LGRDKVRLYCAAKGVALSRLSGDRLVHQPQFAHRELVCEQALLHGAEGGEPLDAMGAALLDAFDLCRSGGRDEF
jgi:hypothetical protein